MKSESKSPFRVVLDYIVFMAIMIAVVVPIHRKQEIKSSAHLAAALLNIHPENETLSEEAQGNIDNQLRMALYKSAPILKYTIGYKRSYMVPIRIIAYFDNHRDGAILFPGESEYNSRIAAFTEEVRSHPNGRDISIVVPVILGLVCLAMFSAVALKKKRKTLERTTES